MKNKGCDPDEILDMLGRYARKKNLQVYLVGGFIRDRMLRKKSRDIDVVMESDALSFARGFSAEYGLPAPVFYGRFGTAMVETGGVKTEFATARKESYPDDSRKPFVEKATIMEDCSRRDFTINAMAESLLTGERLDYFSGRQDLRNGILRTPVEPSITFYDDPLRILRGIRFASRLNFTVEDATMEGMRKNVHRLRIVSSERIADELVKILEMRVPSRGLLLMDSVGVLETILPEVHALKSQSSENCKELFPHTLKVMDNVSLHTRNSYLKMAALLHDIGKPKTYREERGKVSFHRHEFVGERMTYNICRRLRISEEHSRYMGFLIRYHLRPHLLAKENPTDSALRRFVKETGKNLKPLFTLAKADITSSNAGRIAIAVGQLEALERRALELNRKDRLSSFRLAVDGHRIMEIFGLGTGRIVGLVKDYLENMVMEGLIENKKRPLTRYMKDKKEDILTSVTGEEKNGK